VFYAKEKFKIKNCLLEPPAKDILAPGKPPQRKRELFKHEIKISKFFPFLGTILTCQYQDSRSGSADPFDSGSNPDSDPKYCSQEKMIFY
jgi:hypothetical protein